MLISALVPSLVPCFSFHVLSRDGLLKRSIVISICITKLSRFICVNAEFVLDFVYHLLIRS